MFLQFFTSLRDAQIPVTLREYLTLMEALDKDVADKSVDDFYYLSRACLVKDERNLDKFDRVFRLRLQGVGKPARRDGEGRDSGGMAEKSWRRNISPRKKKRSSRPWAGKS